MKAKESLDDALIVGGGMAGLSAALAMKERGLSFTLLEAQADIGGRGATLTLADGIAVDLGAHWLHGQDSPLHDVVRRYELPYHGDGVRRARVYRDSKEADVPIEGWLEQAIDPVIAGQIEKGEIDDRPIHGLGRDAASRERLALFARMWDGLSPLHEPSAREFLSDKSKPGGWQMPGGIQSIMEAMADDAGREYLHLKSVVKRIVSTENGVQVTLRNRRVFHAKACLLTASLAVLKRRSIAIEPPFGAALMKQLAGMEMGQMNKFVFALSEAFFEERGLPVNLSIQLLDDYPHFCHVRSAGSPLINLFVSGPRAGEIESLTPRQAIAYAKRILSPVPELSGFERHLTAPAIISRWTSNPFTGGSYSACLPGHARTGPRRHGNIILCGDSFDTDYPSALAGAYRSGRAAVRQLA